jgi:hypothetical protein
MRAPRELRVLGVEPDAHRDREVEELDDRVEVYDLFLVFNVRGRVGAHVKHDEVVLDVLLDFLDGVLELVLCTIQTRRVSVNAYT